VVAILAPSGLFRTGGGFEAGRGFLLDVGVAIRSLGPTLLPMRFQKKSLVESVRVKLPHFK